MLDMGSSLVSTVSRGGWEAESPEEGWVAKSP